MAALHPPVEEYLRAVHELEEEGTEAIQARLAERLHLSAPSVSEMVRRLERDGYMELLPDRRIRLTGIGREYAEKIVRRHRLADHRHPRRADHVPARQPHPRPPSRWP